MSTPPVVTPPTPAPTPVPPTPPAPPTATISASPNPSPTPGGTVILMWSTTNAVAADLSNVGPVALSGTQSVSPTTSTNYTLKAIAADGSSQTATATVVVTGTPVPPPPEPITTPAGAVAQLQLDIMDDVAATKGALSNVAAQARTEYEALSEPARGRLHQALNDLESAFSVSLAGIHTLFGVKK
jgi:hypothetical protein